MDENHKYGFVRFRRGYVFCNCKGCNPHPKQPKQQHRRPDEEPAGETNWSWV